MSKTNKKGTDGRVDRSARVAGGAGAYAAKQDAEALLRRAVMANLLWEDNYYEDGEDIVAQIVSLLPNVPPQTCFDIAVEARNKQKLRHVPLLIARWMAALDSHKHLVGKLLPEIIQRPDELAEFLAIYWRDGREPISKQAKRGLAEAFSKFNAYQMAKYNRDDSIKLRDVMRMVRPKPPQGKEELYRQIYTNALPTPDTWEVALSAGKDKKETWTRLISEKKLGALAFVRNLRNMEEAGVDRDLIKEYFETVSTRWLLPLNMLAAARATPRYENECEALMLRSLAGIPKLPGRSIVVVDVSGSMNGSISSKSIHNRLHAAAAMAMMAVELCEEADVYATAGSDIAGVHATELLKPRRGFAMMDEVLHAERELGGGGIFTRQCLEHIRKEYRGKPDRILVFSDSQDCDRRDPVPAPFGARNYIIDVSAHTRGVNYRGLWTAEISGWSEHFLTYIAGLEGVALGSSEQDQE